MSARNFQHLSVFEHAKHLVDVGVLNLNPLSKQFLLYSVVERSD
jgi:hypothetical protein